MNQNFYSQFYQSFPVLHEQELRGTEGMKVTLLDKPNNPYYAIACGQSASWRPWKVKFSIQEMMDLLSGLAEGKVWPGQAFESVNFTFAIENISRACTHQLVRARIGVGFMQESGREGTWDKAKFITPLTILENEWAHVHYVRMMGTQMDLYKSMKNENVPAQDARFLMGHAVAQNIWMTINFVALLNWCSKRLCCTMQWEINTLARMVRDQVLMAFPHLGVLLKSNCERKGGCASITNFYEVGANNNGNKVYWPYEERLCGKAGMFSEMNIESLLRKELESMKGAV